MSDFNDDDFKPDSLGDFKDESEKKLYEALRKSPNLDYDPDEDEMTEEQFRAYQERRQRIAERREAGRNKRAKELADREARVKSMGKVAGTRMVPAKTKPARGIADITKEETKPLTVMQKRAEEKEKRGRKIFYVCLGIYVLIFVVLAFIFLRYTDKCLRRYEASQYENVIGGIVDKFADSVKDGTVLDSVQIPEHACVFESEDLYRQTYLKLLRDSGTFSYGKDKKSYDTSHPVYDIFSSDGTLVAKIGLRPENEKTIFAMLRVSDWVVDYVTPVFSVTTSSYRITIPDNYRVAVNGITVGDEFLKGDPVPVKTNLNQEVLAYVTIPSLITYEVVGLAEKPEIKIYNGLGNEVEYTPDEAGNIKIDVQVGVKGEMSQDRREFALETAQMYADFLARDLGGEKYGLAKIQKRLLKGSFHYEEAKHYANDWDITFISDHKDDKPKYTDVSVSEYTEYSDECYSCRIKFTKNMILIKTNGHKEVNVDSIYYFVYADDSDDNVINPHWCMVAEESYEAVNTGN